jgi:hypothetical protein
MPTMKNAKKKVQDEAKKASVDAKKVGGKGLCFAKFQQ